MTVFAGDPGPDYNNTVPIDKSVSPAMLNPGMGDDPVVVANSLLSVARADPMPVNTMPPTRAVVMSPLGAPQVYFTGSDSVLYAVDPIAPAAKGGGAQNQDAATQIHSAAYMTAIDAFNNPTTLEEQPWGEDEVMISGPLSPGAGGPQYSTSGDAVLNDVGKLLTDGLNGAQQAAATIAASHGYDGTTDAYPFSYGDPGHQGARNAFASANTSGGSGLLVLLFILWVIFK